MAVMNMICMHDLLCTYLPNLRDAMQCIRQAFIQKRVYIHQGADHVLPILMSPLRRVDLTTP